MNQGHFGCLIVVVILILPAYITLACYFVLGNETLQYRLTPTFRTARPDSRLRALLHHHLAVARPCCGLSRFLSFVPNSDLGFFLNSYSLGILLCGAPRRAGTLSKLLFLLGAIMMEYHKSRWMVPGYFRYGKFYI